jgi:hypothetical protein
MKAWPAAQVVTFFNSLALKARNKILKPVQSLSHSVARLLCRAFSAVRTKWPPDLGRCPRLLHFAPLALRAGVFTQALTDVAIKYRPCGPENRMLLNQCAIICDALH